MGHTREQDIKVKCPCNKTRLTSTSTSNLHSSLVNLQRFEAGTMPSINSCQVSESHGLRHRKTHCPMPSFRHNLMSLSVDDVDAKSPHKCVKLQMMQSLDMSRHKHWRIYMDTWSYKTIRDFVHDQRLCAAPYLQWLEDIIPQSRIFRYTRVEMQVVDWSHGQNGQSVMPEPVFKVQLSSTASLR